MIRNYLLTAFRNITKNPLYSIINILSLAIGIAACMVIYLFITDERSFDAQHSRSEYIYRLDEIQNFTGTKEQKVALSMAGMGPAMLADFPEVTEYTRYWNRGKTLFSVDENKVVVDNVVMVDSTFLNIFDFEMIAGDRSTALNEPNSILLTETESSKFFASPEEAVGSSIQVGNNLMEVTAVLKDVPETSHLQFEALASITTVTREDPSFNERWGSNFLNTYLVLEDNVNIPALEAKFPDFMVRHTENDQVNEYYTLFVQRLDEVHLGSMDIEHDYNNYRKFNGAYLDVFALVGIFILIIASVNFMNLATARASHRWKEVGVRKVVGAMKSQLFVQFIIESLLLSLFALVLGILLDLLFIPWLNTMVGRQLDIMMLLSQPLMMLWVFLTALGLGLLAGLYPSIYMTAFKTSEALKGTTKGNKSIFRSSLVVVQFGLALAMIVSTLIVVQQLNYMKNKDIGFTTDQMLLVDMSREANEKFETLKTELSKSSKVLGVTASGQRIGNNFHQWGFKVRTDTGVYEMSPSNVAVDFDYLEVYEIEVTDGRGFNKDFPTDDGYAYVINEALAKELNLDEPVGTPAGHSWYNDDSLGTIIGVTEDFNFNSLHHRVNTLSLVVHSEWGYDEMSVKIDGNDVSGAIEEVRAVYESMVQDWPFEYSFLDQHFSELYKSDQQMSVVVTAMAVLAILIACMGLFGLASITTERKIKEIGIRKVLGASISQITFLLAKNFAILIGVAFLIVSPITYFLLEGWLENFAFRIDIDLMLFFLGGVIALVIAMLTIGYHTLKASLSNPVEALRYE